MRQLSGSTVGELKVSELKTIVVSLPKDRQDDLKKLYAQFRNHVNGAERLKNQRYTKLNTAVDSLSRLQNEINGLNGRPLDWESSWIELEGNCLVVKSPLTEQAGSDPTPPPGFYPVEQSPYLEAINCPPVFKGHDRETGKELCEFRFDPATERFKWFAAVPEEKWTEEQARSVCSFLEHLNDNRAELTRRLRVRAVEEVKQ
jgi:hypothetical protein